MDLIWEFESYFSSSKSFMAYSGSGLWLLASQGNIKNGLELGFGSRISNGLGLGFRHGVLARTIF